MAVKFSKLTQHAFNQPLVPLPNQFAVRNTSDADLWVNLEPKGVAAPNTPGSFKIPPEPKVSVTIRLRPETIAKFKATGKGWQTRISAILDAYS